ncbi:sushi, von Willebrand factor type A, EGF and pentraxin domain-containing protein 1-like isoform X2 [Ostrea edulis]|uniref:sushi, von Willebrand factor type A, EGF and pentraxin domain-containing protein 1-like isoform X2 n=1 Tax=Ostrea edulis TaxID=37623 RepID=UPI0024AF2824|nr:sushi, von Willebrand factor type A, EGF and pentraxin domain-containing protein 1-like isoform X2 [Ostrea edulis]
MEYCTAVPLLWLSLILVSRIFGEPTDTLSPCPFSDLAHAEFQSCRNTFDDSVLPIETVLWDSLPPFTICNYKCISKEGESVSRMCENGRWTGPKCKHIIVKRFWRRRRRYSPPPPPPPDTTPPVIGCPGDIFVTALQLQTTAVVSWTEPSAHDSKDGNVATIRSGPAPGSVFSEGVTTISYTARDSSGNSASCSFRVHITVKRCSAPSYSGSFTCTAGSSYLYGAVCTFDCSAIGHELIGQSTVTCLSSGSWDNAIPSCQRVNCGDPGGLTNGGAVTSGILYGDNVTYTCQTGYNITGDVNRTCQSNAVWSGSRPKCWYSISCSSSPCLNGATCTNTLGGYRCWCTPGWTGSTCQTDIQPPVMTGCQNSETILTTQPEAFASWNIPSFQDPMGRQLIVSSNYPTNSTSFPWGDFTVQYSALKPSNGLRTECNFTLSIRPVPCTDLVIPNNGAILCNGWDTDILNLCVLVCKSGYSVPLGYSEDVVYVCGSSGNWSPAGSLPECIAVTSTYSRSAPSFTDCSSNTTQPDLSSHYIDLVKKSNFAHICKTSTCDVNNIDIRC